MFRILPFFGGDPRTVAEIVNGIMNGKTNNVGIVTLATGGATTTTITDRRIGPDSILLLTPLTASANTDSVPYGAFQDSTDQVAANTTTAYAITFDTTDYSNGVTLSNSSRMNVANAGVYNIQFSIQFKNTTNDSQDVDVWFRKNGTNIDKSNSRFGLPARKAAGDPSHIIGAMNFFVELAASDYVAIVGLCEARSHAECSHLVLAFLSVILVGQLTRSVRKFLCKGSSRLTLKVAHRTRAIPSGF